ncbi:MAG TPA: MgtC/SapB family protein [Rhodanobacteraceae bacterium]|nr:MgtC/SapB family protein [Rhodanobacteraceae bacterium]
MIAPVDILERLLLAAFLGGVIGMERERREWAAGLRTHMLVCLGAALTIIVSTFGFGDVLGTPGVVLDPSRIAAQVISGIGFLGAGTILFLQREQVIRGLTTAAGLWAVAAIGLAAGSGMWLAAVLTTVVAWLIMAGLKPLERRFFNHHAGPPRLLLGLSDEAELAPVRAELDKRGTALKQMVLHHDVDGDDQLELLFESSVSERELAQLADALRHLPGVVTISFGVAARKASPHP